MFDKSMTGIPHSSTMKSKWFSLRKAGGFLSSHQNALILPIKSHVLIPNKNLSKVFLILCSKIDQKLSHTSFTLLPPCHLELFKLTFNILKFFLKKTRCFQLHVTSILWLHWSQFTCLWICINLKNTKQNKTRSQNKNNESHFRILHCIHLP